ncbi:ribokinase [uncultured Mitsuokella sp.]|uniref:ribokinase n=1 Tax=uncultured Mitsuokella sp. TaxID=453120 RepID=UPI00267093B6|nr:ribokinase [uncultured Mitsuokella sp.]
MKIAVIGSTMMDIVSYMDNMPQAGETRRVEGFHIASGGKGANQAIAAAKLGADVVMMTAVGDDMFGEQSRKNFQNHHIDMSLVKTAKDTSNGIATIVVESSGQNRILINPGANEKLTPEDIEKAAAELETCGLFVLQLEVPLETVYAAIRFAKKHGIKVLLNPAPASRELSLDMACQCDFFVPNETELSILVNKPVDTVAQVQEAAQSLVAQGLTNVIVTMGSRGSLLVNKDETQLVPSLKVEAVDSTGAGDAFIGCFVDTYARTEDVLGSMQRASKYAALSVTRKGTQDSYADAQEFADFLDA